MFLNCMTGLNYLAYWRFSDEKSITKS